MEHLYYSAGISRQAYSKWDNYVSTKKVVKDVEVIKLAKQVRKKYLPGAGARQLYKYIRKNSELDSQLLGLGKHKFESICFNHGMRISARRYVPKTTVHGAYAFQNKIAGSTIYDINKVFVSDICYLFGVYGNLIGYATTCIDVYSRYLLGLAFSRTMQAVETVHPVLKQAFKERKVKTFENTYFHSDQGKQYIEKNFIRSLRKRNIESSMGKSCYENPFAESFNDTLKNHMLNEYNFDNFKQLKRKERFIKHVYNHNKTHSSIGDITPSQFERNLSYVELKNRTGLEMKIIT